MEKTVKEMIDVIFEEAKKMMDEDMSKKVDHVVQMLHHQTTAINNRINWWADKYYKEIPELAREIRALDDRLDCLLLKLEMIEEKIDKV